MPSKHYPKIKSFGRKHSRMRVFHKNKDSRSTNQNKEQVYFISSAVKTNVNRIFFMSKRNFISGKFHFGFHVNILSIFHVNIPSVIESYKNKAVDYGFFFLPINFSSRLKSFNSIDALEDNLKCGGQI